MRCLIPSCFLSRTNDEVDLSEDIILCGPLSSSTSGTQNKLPSSAGAGKINGLPLSNDCNATNVADWPDMYGQHLDMHGNAMYGNGDKGTVGGHGLWPVHVYAAPIFSPYGIIASPRSSPRGVTVLPHDASPFAPGGGGCGASGMSVSQAAYQPPTALSLELPACATTSSSASLNSMMHCIPEEADDASADGAGGVQHKHSRGASPPKSSPTRSSPKRQDLSERSLPASSQASLLDPQPSDPLDASAGHPTAPARPVSCSSSAHSTHSTSRLSPRDSPSQATAASPRSCMFVTTQNADVASAMPPDLGTDASSAVAAVATAVPRVAASRPSLDRCEASAAAAVQACLPAVTPPQRSAMRPPSSPAAPHITPPRTTAVQRMAAAAASRAAGGSGNPASAHRPAGGATCVKLLSTSTVARENELAAMRDGGGLYGQYYARNCGTSNVAQHASSSFGEPRTLRSSSLEGRRTANGVGCSSGGSSSNNPFFFTPGSVRSSASSRMALSGAFSRSAIFGFRSSIEPSAQRDVDFRPRWR